MIPQKFTAKTASIPSPIGGWNARDSLANMDAMDAVTMNNWFPTPTDITFRKGFSKYSIGITGQVNTLMNYSSPTGNKLFAIGTSVISIVIVSDIIIYQRTFIRKKEFPPIS